MEFLKLEISVVDDVGIVPATLYAYFVFRSQKLADSNGWFVLDSGEITETLHLSRMSLSRYRDLLQQNGYIDYVQGNNQRIRPKYRIMR